jgi:VanZ family protein
MFSNQKAEQSTEKSQSLVKNTIATVYKIFHPNANEEKINEIVEKYDVPVRKIAHFTEFLILGTLVFFTLRLYNISSIFIMILFCVAYATFDEFHQLFVQERSGNIIDIIIDSLGSISSILIFNKLKGEKK